MTRMPAAPALICQATVALGRLDRGPQHPCVYRARYRVGAWLGWPPNRGVICGVHARAWQRRALTPLAGAKP